MTVSGGQFVNSVFVPCLFCSISAWRPL